LPLERFDTPQQRRVQTVRAKMEGLQAYPQAYPLDQRRAPDLPLQTQDRCPAANCQMRGPSFESRPVRAARPWYFHTMADYILKPVAPATKSCIAKPTCAAATGDEQSLIGAMCSLTWNKLQTGMARRLPRQVGRPLALSICTPRLPRNAGPEQAPSNAPRINAHAGTATLEDPHFDDGYPAGSSCSFSFINLSCSFFESRGVA